MACVIAMVMYRGGFLKVLFESFFKGPRGFPYVFIIIGKGHHTGTSIWPHFCWPWCLCPWGTISRFLMVLLPLKWVCIPYLPQIFLMLLQRPWVYGITIWPLVLTSLVTGWVPVMSWLLAQLLTSMDDLLSLFSTLSKAHLGYFQLVRAFLRCSNSFWRSSGQLQTVLALWVRVLMTLYLTERWWWLSNCKYWSMWVGFLYTVVDSLPPVSGFTMVSKKGMAPSLSSTANVLFQRIYQLLKEWGLFLLELLFCTASGMRRSEQQHKRWRHAHQITAAGDIAPVQPSVQILLGSMSEDILKVAKYKLAPSIMTHWCQDLLMQDLHDKLDWWLVRAGLHGTT